MQVLADRVEAFRGEGAFAHSDGNAGSYNDAMVVAMVVVVVVTVAMMR